MSDSRKHKKKWLMAAAVLLGVIVLVVGLYRYLEHRRITYPNRSHPPMVITDNPQTWCMGRMLVDLPERLSPQPQDIQSGVHLSHKMRVRTETGVSLEEFERRVDARWAQVQTYTHETGGRRPYAQLPELHVVREHGVSMAFYHTMIRSNARWVEGRREFDNVMVHDAEGYYWDNGTMFTIKNDTYRYAVDKVAGMMSGMRYLGPGEIPDEPGICLNGGFIASYFASQAETISWVIELPYGLKLLFVTSTKVRDKTMLEHQQEKEGLLGWALSQEPDMIYGNKTYRAAQRTGDHFAAEELVMGSAEGVKENDLPGFKINFGGAWEFPGKLHPDPLPYIRMELDIWTHSEERPAELGSYPPVTQDSVYPMEEEFFAVWDLIAASIRPFPGALTLEPPKPEPLLRGPDEAQRSADHQALDDFLGEKPSDQ